MVKALLLLTHFHFFHTSAFTKVPSYQRFYRQLHQQSEFFLNMSSSSKEHKVCIHWFRNGLRFHDNKCFLDACTRSETMIPLYVIDPEAPFAQTKNRKAGAIRANFILESIKEMDKKLKAANNGSRMIVLLGKPHEVIPEVINKIQADAIYYER
jgi:deoxyribodipyrimidine photolyase